MAEPSSARPTGLLALARRAVSACLARPRATLLVFLALSLAWLPALPALRLETDGRDLFSPDHPAVVFQDRIDRRFATSDFLVVGVEAAAGSDVFEPAILNALLDLGERVAALEGVAADEIRGLATEVAPRRESGLLRLAPPLPASVHTRAEADRVREAALAEPLFHGTLVSADGRGAALYVPIETGADRRRVFHRVRRLVAERWAAEAGLAGHRAHVVGPAAAESLLGEHVLTDLALLLPLSLAVVACVLGIWFRRWGAVTVGLGEGAAVVLWTLGLMSVTGRPISLVTVVMPVILTTYCVADTIHIGQCLLARRRERPEAAPAELIESAIDEVIRPVAFTSLTTAAGFLAFAVSPIPPLRTFGLFSAAGVLLALLVSLYVVPSGLLLTGFARRAGGAARPRLAAGLERLAVRAAARPAAVAAAAVLITALLGAGALRLEIQDSWVGNFSRDSPLVRSDAWFNRSFFGGNVVNVVLSRPGAGAYDPDLLADLERLQRRLERRPEVGGTRSLVDPLTAVARALEGAGRRPASAGEGEEWALLSRMAGGSRSLDPYVDPAGETLNLWIFLKRGDYQRTAAVLDEIGAFRWGGDAGAEPVSWRPAGDAYLGYLLVGSIARSQIYSALAALAVTFLTVLWMLRRLRSSVLAVLPVTLSVIWNLGLMGWLGLPLGIATSTFCAIAFGVGVDFALHWIARLELGRRRGMGFEGALRFTGARTGSAILSNGLVLMLGFAVLLLSAVPPTRLLALILFINLATCLAATLVLLPAVATLLERRRVRGVAAMPVLDAGGAVR
jgi:hypothetical protein